MKEFAFGLGLSPIVDVLDENASKRSLPASRPMRRSAPTPTNSASCRGGFGYDTMRPRRDWRDDVNKSSSWQGRTTSAKALS